VFSIAHRCARRRTGAICGCRRTDREGGARTRSFLTPSAGNPTQAPSAGRAQLSTEVVRAARSCEVVNVFGQVDSLRSQLPTLNFQLPRPPTSRAPLCHRELAPAGSGVLRSGGIRRKVNRGCAGRLRRGCNDFYLCPERLSFRGAEARLGLGSWKLGVGSSRGFRALERGRSHAGPVDRPGIHAYPFCLP
jgi:hypothetical protein